MKKTISVCEKCFADTLRVLSKSATIIEVTDYKDIDEQHESQCERCQSETEPMHHLIMMVI